MIDVKTFCMAENNVAGHYKEMAASLTPLKNLFITMADETPEAGYYTFSPDTEHKLRLLASPHHKTIIKAMEVLLKETAK